MCGETVGVGGAVDEAGAVASGGVDGFAAGTGGAGRGVALSGADAGGVALKAEADETGLAAEGGVGLCAIATVGDRAKAIFVHFSVAVIVFVVAADLLSVGFDLSDTRLPLPANTGFCSVFTNADTTSVHGACITSSGLARNANTTPFVRLAIAVVVEAISTDLLRCWQGLTLTDSPLPIDARFSSTFAYPHALRVVWPRVASPRFALFASTAAFIDRPIAIVVLAIARFGAWFTCAIARSP